MSAHPGSTVVRFDDAEATGGFTNDASRFIKFIELAAAATAG